MQREKTFGYTGKSPSANLSRKMATVFDTPLDLCSHFIEGRGLGVSFISDSIHKSFDDPNMPRICAPGPLVGTEAPTSGRFSVVSRLPLTNTVFDCSIGGKFATELKRAGYDPITVFLIARGEESATDHARKQEISLASLLCLVKSVPDLRYRQYGSRRFEKQ